MAIDTRYRASDLIAYATALFAAAGCDGDKPATIAAGLVEADLLGHTTHGLQLAAAYLAELSNGGMLAHGEPHVIADRGATITWDGQTLPGVWLTAKAIDFAVERVATYGVVTVVIRRSHHIGCLAAFLQRATDRGLMIILACSDPATASVSPFGGRKAVFTPDPFAVGIPTDGDPIWIDISASITTNGLAGRLKRESKRFPGAWALDADGVATDDPGVLFENPPGTLLPTGGVDHGHKGYGLALMVEALTQGLGGFGRSKAPSGWGIGVRANHRPGGVRWLRSILPRNRLASANLPRNSADTRRRCGPLTGATGPRPQTPGTRGRHRTLSGHPGGTRPIRGPVPRAGTDPERSELTDDTLPTMVATLPVARCPEGA